MSHAETALQRYKRLRYNVSESALASSVGSPSSVDKSSSFPPRLRAYRLNLERPFDIHNEQSPLEYGDYMKIWNGEWEERELWARGHFGFLAAFTTHTCFCRASVVIERCCGVLVVFRTIPNLIEHCRPFRARRYVHSFMRVVSLIVSIILSFPPLSLSLIAHNRRARLSQHHRTSGIHAPPSFGGQCRRLANIDAVWKACPRQRRHSQ
jgi:hypothetical protein